jgi:hypothetical protein
LSLRGIENARKVIGLYICPHNASSYVRELEHFQVKLVSIHPHFLSGKSGNLRIKGILLCKFLKSKKQPFSTSQRTLKKDGYLSTQLRRIEFNNGSNTPTTTRFTSTTTKLTSTTTRLILTNFV